MTGVAEWLAVARPGERLVYARGNLARLRHDRTLAHHTGYSLTEQAERTCDLANEALALAEAGRVLLVQQRVGDDDFEYQAVAR